MIELLFTLAFWPWVFLVCAILAFGTAAYWESVTAATLVAVVTSGLMAYLWDAGPVAVLIHNPGAFAMYAAAYIAVGVPWAVFKWHRHIQSDHCQRAMRDGLKRYRGMDNPAYPVHAYGSEDEQRSFIKSEWFPPECLAATNRERIMSWMALWPLSVIGYVAGDLLRDAYQKLFSMVVGVFDSVTRKGLPKS